MGILGNGLWGAGMRSVQDREANILRRFKVASISPLPILVAGMLSGWLIYMPALVVLVALAHFLYAMPLPQNWISLIVGPSVASMIFKRNSRAATGSKRFWNCSPRVVPVKIVRQWPPERY